MKRKRKLTLPQIASLEYQRFGRRLVKAFVARKLESLLLPLLSCHLFLLLSSVYLFFYALFFYCWKSPAFVFFFFAVSVHSSPVLFVLHPLVLTLLVLFIVSCLQYSLLVFLSCFLSSSPLVLFLSSPDSVTLFFFLFCVHGLSLAFIESENSMRSPPNNEVSDRLQE